MSTGRSNAGRGRENDWDEDEWPKSASSRSNGPVARKKRERARTFPNSCSGERDVIFPGARLARDWDGETVDASVEDVDAKSSPRRLGSTGGATSRIWVNAAGGDSLLIARSSRPNIDCAFVVRGGVALAVE